MVEKVLHRLGPHPALEVLVVAIGDRSPERLGLNQCLRLHLPKDVKGILDQLDLSLGSLFPLPHLLFDLSATSGDLLALGPALFHLCELDLEAFEALLLPLRELVLDDLLF